ncbi:hypothetical protein F2Q70_00030750 [Brassica cretica]|uniref:Replication factor A C-terminal domain-containing protein n=1 Tax=Brassica cretica TaxID=69181 RepID=A0A8S9FF92_BRACR|nr:hypothetical protein F2Q70_00030750 [Brassica cretica]
MASIQSRNPPPLKKLQLWLRNQTASLLSPPESPQLPCTLKISHQGTVMQGFIPASRVQQYLCDLKPGTIYKLFNSFGSHTSLLCLFLTTIPSLSTKTGSGSIHTRILKLTVTSKVIFTERPVDDCIMDVVGHTKLVNGQTLIKRPILDETEISITRRVMVHLESHEGSVMKLYLWDQAATDFFKKFTAYENTPTVLLVTTVNPKHLGGTLTLSSMSSSRVFMDYDVQPTINYFNWMGSKPEIQELVNAEVVTKAETMTIAEIYAYIKQAKCIATIDDVVRDSAWYYIACSGCHTKAIKGPTFLMCAKCGNDNVAGVRALSSILT